jgi:hypothetical protein
MTEEHLPECPILKPCCDDEQFPEHGFCGNFVGRRRLSPGSAPNAQPGPGRANREDDNHKPTSRRHNLTRMRTALILATILIGIVAITLLAAGCAA